MAKCMTDPRHGGVHGPRNINSELRDCAIDARRVGGAVGVCFFPDTIAQGREGWWEIGRMDREGVRSGGMHAKCVMTAVQ